MTGGLIQLVLSGKQDGYLTFNPEITFFKKVYRRHTIFGSEFLESFPEQEAEYNNRISFKLNNLGDLISKCYLEIELPELKFQESEQVSQLKINILNNLNKEIQKWKSQYTNVKSFCSIEILLYQQLIKLLESTNINLNNLKNLTSRFNAKYKKEKDKVLNLILASDLLQMNLSAYIMGLNKNIIVDESIDINDNTQIYVSDLRNEITNYYNNMIKILKYYFTNYIYYKNEFSKVSNKNVNVAWVENIAQFYFTDYEVEIAGQIVESYSADQSFIYQSHHLKQEMVDNYNEMIGNKPELITFNNDTKPTYLLTLPLNFWFCKEPGISLPSLALANAHIALNLKINDIRKLIYFQDIEKDYYDFLNITIPYETYFDSSEVSINSKLNLESYNYDIDSRLITFKCSNINKNLFKFKYPTLSNTTIDEIFGLYANELEIMTLNEWINYKLNYTQNANILDINKFNNYNEYFSFIPKPKVKLITESYFLDEIERNKFGSSRLEYVVEGFQENIFDIKKQLLFNYELSIDRPVKELIWFYHPKLFSNGLTEYGKRYLSKYDYSDFFKNKIYSKQSITFNQLHLIKDYTDDSYFQKVQPFQKYNNSLPNGVFCFNFCLYPEEIQPSGTANFSILKGKQVSISLDFNFIQEYFNQNINPNELDIQLKFLARSYNFLVIEKGSGKMIFTTN